MTATFQWFPERLNAAIAAAYKESLGAAKVEADALKPSAKVTVSLIGNELKSSPAFFEEGARPHEIAPKGSFLYLKGENRFVSAPVEHPGSPPKPHIGPASVSWATRIFQAVARARLAASGF
jgi:hypothetical protein